MENTSWAQSYLQCLHNGGWIKKQRQHRRHPGAVLSQKSFPIFKERSVSALPSRVIFIRGALPGLCRGCLSARERIRGLLGRALMHRSA